MSKMLEEEGGIFRDIHEQKPATSRFQVQLRWWFQHDTTKPLSTTSQEDIPNKVSNTSLEQKEKMNKQWR